MLMIVKTKSLRSPVPKLKTNSILLLTLLFIAPYTIASLVTDYNFTVIESFPHSRKAFTQGLEFHQNILFESNGQRGESVLIKRRLSQTTAIISHHLHSDLFAEGITVLDGKIYQLTWTSGKGFIYNADTLQPEGEFHIDGEGWGLTNNGKDLILSDGSSRLTIFDPKSNNKLGVIDVKLDGKPINKINELEWVEGLIYANVWQSNWIIMIDPSTGNVVGKVYLKDLLPKKMKNQNTDVLNGIAYDKANKRLLVTGKYWPRIFHIELTAK